VLPARDATRHSDGSLVDLYLSGSWRLSSRVLTNEYSILHASSWGSATVRDCGERIPRTNTVYGTRADALAALRCPYRVDVYRAAMAG
jgi:hypothetical protein